MNWNFGDKNHNLVRESDFMLKFRAAYLYVLSTLKKQCKCKENC